MTFYNFFVVIFGNRFLFLQKTTNDLLKCLLFNRCVNVLLTNPIWLVVTRMQVMMLPAILLKSSIKFTALIV